MAVALGYYASVPSNSATAPTKEIIMSIAQSAASFVSTGSAAKNTTPRSRKASKPAPAPVVVEPVPSSLVAMFAEQQIAAPKAEAKPKANKVPTTLLYIAKTFKPRTDQLIDRKAEGKGNFAQMHNWEALVNAFNEAGGELSYDLAVAAVLAAGKAGLYEKTCNARGFVQGRVRNGHLKAV